MTETFDRLSTALADRYTIERELGSGGMATVYLAEDLKHHRKVAVKLLRPELAAVLGAEQFLKEIETTANRGGRGHRRTGHARGLVPIPSTLRLSARWPSTAITIRESGDAENENAH